MKLTIIFVNLLKKLFILFLIFQINILSLSAFPMNNFKDKMIVEELRLKVPAAYKYAWLKAEREVWQPWLEKQEGFQGRQIFYNDEKGEALLLVNWKNKTSWKNISMEEVNKIQDVFEENIKNSTKLEMNPLQLVYEGELFKQS